jgi:hypothetical protein
MLQTRHENARLLANPSGFVDLKTLHGYPEPRPRQVSRKPVKTKNGGQRNQISSNHPRMY